MGVLSAIEAQKLPLGTDLKGHPSMARYIEEGYEILIL